MENLLNKKDDDVFEKIKNILIKENLIDKDEKLFFIKSQERFQGIIVNEYLVYFASKLSEKNKTKSRNTYLAQNFFPCFLIAKKLDKKIFVTVNPFDVDIDVTKIISSSINFDLKIFSSLNVIISKKFGKIERFKNIDEFLQLKTRIRSKNSRNMSTFFIKKENSIFIYGKVDGANLKKTFLETLMIININTNYKLFFISLNNQKKDKNLLLLLKDNKIKILMDNEMIETVKNDLILDSKESVTRNQPLFYKNIINKYSNFINIEECFACNYNISENLISAHIYRVTDIKNDYNSRIITKENAIDFITSGENGFLFCPNHDKEFEKGMIIFDYKKMKFVPSKNYSLDLAKLIIHKNYSSNLKTQKFVENIKKHLKRIQQNKTK